MTALRLAWVFAVASCVAPAADHDGSDDAPDTVVGDPAPAPDHGVAVPYDHAIQASSHNSFEREEPLLDQLVYGRIRSLELDIHSRKEGVDAAPGSWFVFHEDLPLNRYSSCAMLADACGCSLHSMPPCPHTRSSPCGWI